MDGGIRLFFAFISLIVVAYLVIYLVTNSKGTTAVSNSIFTGFQGFIGQLARAQQATPGQL